MTNLMNDKAVNLAQELQFRSYRPLFSDNEIIDYTARQIPFETILNEANHRSSFYLVESYGGGAFSLHKRKGNKLQIDGKWRTVFDAGYITHNGRQYNVTLSKNKLD